jgi:hypothetical protein
VANSLKASGVASVELQKKEATESGQQEGRERFFFFIKIIYWVALQLPKQPNVLGSIVATQTWNPKIGQLV